MPDRLQFYSKSQDKAPGQGAGESVVNNNIYQPLANIPHWRRHLSNFSDSCVVKHHGLSFRTPEHCFHFDKCCIADALTARQFALESHSQLSQGTGLDARKARKLVILNAVQLAEWDAKREDCLKQIWLYKAKHCQLFRTVLASTLTAELWHYPGRGSQAERWTALEEIRATGLFCQETCKSAL